MNKQEAIDLINERIRDDAQQTKENLLSSLQLLADRASEAVERLKATEIDSSRYCSVSAIIQSNVSTINELDTQLRLLNEQASEFRVIRRAAKN